MDRTWKQQRKSGIWLPDEKAPYGWELIEDHPLADGLIGCWVMNEGSGEKIYDLSGNENHGIFTNGPIWIPERVGRVVYFDGDDDYINVDGLLDDIATGPVTVSLWFIPYEDYDTSHPMRMLFSLSDFESANDIQIYAYLDNPELTFKIGVEKNLSTSGVTFTAGNWYHVVGTYDGSSAMKIYINGILRGSLTGASREPPYSLVASLGHWVDVPDYEYAFFGAMDNACVYNCCLNASKIAWLYREPKAMLRPKRPRKYFFVVSGQIYELSANIQGATGTATPELDILRALSGAIAAGSATPDTVILKLLKALNANIQAGTATPDDIALLIIKVLSGNIQAGTATSDNITLALLRALTASIQGASDTSAATVAVLRAVSAAIQADTATPDDVVLLIAGILEFSAAISAATATGDIVVLDVLRELSVSITATSVAPDDADLIILREISANIQAASATPDDIALLIVRMLAASIQPSTDTAIIALTIVREISAAIVAGSSTPEAVLSVLREFSATVSPETLTSAITLIIAGLGVIADAVIESLMTQRTISSLTTQRTISSLVAERKVESLTPEWIIEET